LGKTVDSASSSGPLTGLRVLEFADPLAAYTGRLLTDLGAEVIRIELPGERNSVERAPFWFEPGRPRVSMFERFVNAGKRSVTLDPGVPDAQPILAGLLADADVLIESPRAVLADHGLSPEWVVSVNPDLVRVQVSTFGSGGDETDSVIDDLILLGAGGLLSMGGYPDVGPVAAYGEQSTYATAIFAAVAAVAGLIGRRRNGIAHHADVSAQECVAQALEESVMRYILTGEVRTSQGDTAKEAGTGTYRCADGHVSMVAGRLGTAKAWTALVDWMVATDPRSAELAEVQWTRFDYRQQPSAVATFKRIFEDFATGLNRQELYREAQERGIALSPVNDLASVRDNAQLRSREFFVEVEDPDLAKTLTYPGLPYRMSKTPLRPPRPAPQRGADNSAVLTCLTHDDLEDLIVRGVL
jgi:benzylsuccinate CoA-transferase BbsE subunit